jgi:chorismate dehydratase
MLRLAASNYSNSAPLIWSFWKGVRRQTVEFLPDAAPSRCAEMLRTNAVDIALTPVVEFQRIIDCKIIPEVCVASRQSVKSVILVTKGEDLKQTKSIALDVSSKTSVALAKIIFREFFGRNPNSFSHAPDLEEMLLKADAALLIGDPALRVDRQRFRVFDIVELWREFTNLGFVFAFWLARRGTNAAQAADFAAARDEGLRQIEQIIDFYLPQVLFDKTEFRQYLTENISYALDAELLAGLRLFYQLARKHNLIPNLKPLKFL